MASLVSSFLHHSANKIENLSRHGKRKDSDSKRNSGGGNGLGTRLHQAALSMPTVDQQLYYQQPQASHSTECIAPYAYDPASMFVKYSNPPCHHIQNQPLDQQHIVSPTLTPSTSWSTDLSNTNSTYDQSIGSCSSEYGILLDRRSISQGMKLVSIAADEYDEGNEAVALDIYLTGLDKILMALPNKTDAKTKLALREKLLSVEERVGILNLANQRVTKEHNQEGTSKPNLGQQHQQQIIGASLMDTVIISKITQTLQLVTQAASRHNTFQQSEVQQDPKLSTQQSDENITDAVDRVKRFGQILIQASVTLAIMIRQSPIPTLLAFCLQYLVHLLLWIDTHYKIRQHAQDLSVTGIKLLLQADEQYRLHEFLSEILFMMAAAILKAIVAYKEAPCYNPSQSATSSTTSGGESSSSKLQDTGANTKSTNADHLLASSSTCVSTSSYGISSWVWYARR